LLVPSCSALGGDDGSSAAEEAADEFLAAWAAGDVEAMAALVADAPEGVAAQQQELRTSLQVVSAEVAGTMVQTSGR
jgi:hypothetical protein